jgi:uncharacterized protein YecA (UPF0149 family)
MDAKEIALLFCDADAEKIAAGIAAVQADGEAAKAALRANLAHFALAPEGLSSAEGLASLRATLLWLAHWRDEQCFGDLLRLVRQPRFGELLPEKDWLVLNLHRIFGSLAAADDLPVFGDLVLDCGLKQALREQALLVIHFLWLEGRVSEREAVEQYRVLLAQGLDANDSWELWLALLVNAAVVGGVKLKPQVMAVLDGGHLGEQTTFVRKVLNGLFSTSSQQLRDMLRKEHKGPYEDMPAEVAAMLNPPEDEEELSVPERGKPLVREAPKIGRNDPCPCGSGKKYKKCCGAGN